MTSRGEITAVEESPRTQSLLMTGVRIIRAVLTMGVPIVLVRVLSQSEFGAYKQISLITMTAAGVLSLALPSSLFYFVPRVPERSQRLIVQTTLVFGLTGIVGGVLIALNSRLLAQSFGPAVADQALWLGVIVALSVNSLLDTVMIVDRRVKLAALRSVTLDLAQGILVVSAAVATRDLGWVLAMLSLSIAMRVIALGTYIVWRGRDSPPVLPKWQLAEQFKYSAPFFLAILLATARDQFHAYFVATQYSAAQFALYSIGTLQLPFVGHLMQSIGETVVLANTKHYSDGNLSEMQRVWHRATYVVALMVVPMFVVVEFFAEDILSVVFGGTYASAASIWRIYGLMLPLSVFLGATMIRATGDLRHMLIADGVSLAATLAALLLLAGSLGIEAAAWSIVVGNVALIMVVAGRAMRGLQLSLVNYLDWLGVLKIFATAVVVTSLAWLGVRALPELTRLVVGLLLSASGYAVLAWKLALIPDAERVTISRVLRPLIMRISTRTYSGR